MASSSLATPNHHDAQGSVSGPSVPVRDTECSMSDSRSEGRCGHRSVPGIGAAELSRRIAARVGSCRQFTFDNRRRRVLEVVSVAGDIADPATAERIVEKALSTFGRIDTLVNNAGVFIGKPVFGLHRRRLLFAGDVNLTGFSA